MAGIIDKSHMIKILQLIETSDPGGAENVLLMLALHRKDRFKMIAGLLKEGWISQQLKDAGVPVIMIPSGRFIDIKLILNLLKIIKEEQIDIVQSHLLDMNFYSCIAAKIAGIPHISTEHGDVNRLPKNINLKTFIKLKVTSILSNKIVFVSEDTKNIFLRISHTAKEKVSVIYNGRDFKKYESMIDKKMKRAEIGIPEDAIIIGNVASLVLFKGQTYLLKAAQTVLKIFPNAFFIIIGCGKLEKELKKEADDLGISGNIKFLGFRTDVDELLKIMDIFVLPSTAEGFPLSIIEAMASKRPVIATRVSGNPEIVENGVSGVLIDPANPDILADKIIELINNPALAKEMAACGYKKVKDNFNHELMLKKYERLYSELIK
jgi:glycosyltransferase involved in cell wall biosynthesis